MVVVLTTTSHLIWIKNRTSEYDFVENQDFITASQKYETANGGYATRNEYFVPLDMD